MSTDLPSWFTHDASARFDKKLCLLRDKFGDAGIAWYWYLIETLAGQDDGTYPHRLNLLASVSMIPLEHLENFILTCKGLGLIQETKEHLLFSPSLMRRLEKWKAVREKRKVAGSTGAAKRWELKGKVDSKCLAIIANTTAMANANNDGELAIYGKKQTASSNPLGINNIADSKRISHKIEPLETQQTVLDNELETLNNVDSKCIASTVQYNTCTVLDICTSTNNNNINNNNNNNYSDSTKGKGKLSKKMLEVSEGAKPFGALGIVMLSDSEATEVRKRCFNLPDVFDRAIELLEIQMKDNPKKVKSAYRTLLKWVCTAALEDVTRNKKALRETMNLGASNVAVPIKFPTAQERARERQAETERRFLAGEYDGKLKTKKQIEVEQ